MRKDLVLFSGGLDSTSLVLKKIDESSPFDVLYVEGGQSSRKVKMELRAIEAVLDSAAYPSDSRKPQIKIARLDWMNCAGGYLPHTGFSQPQTWLFAASRLASSEAYDRIQVAYVMGDQVSHVLHHLTDMWFNLMHVTGHPSIGLEFPLKSTLKEHLLEDIDLTTFKLIWVCEIPTKEEKRCGYCAACKRLDQAFLIIARTKVNQEKLEHWNSLLPEDVLPRVVWVADKEPVLGDVTKVTDEELVSDV